MNYCTQDRPTRGKYLSAGSLRPLASIGQSPVIKVAWLSSAPEYNICVLKEEKGSKAKGLEGHTPTSEQAWRSAFARWHSVQNFSTVSSYSSSDLVPGV